MLQSAMAGNQDESSHFDQANMWHLAVPYHEASCGSSTLFGDDPLFLGS